MNFSKAFDKVDHNKLIYKLSAHEIHPLTARWIKSFLQCRTQQVRIDGCTLDTLLVISGVPQGSVFGPCLFLSYINYLLDSVKSKVRLFADDAIMYLTVKSTTYKQFFKTISMLWNNGSGTGPWNLIPTSVKY